MPGRSTRLVLAALVLVLLAGCSSGSTPAAPAVTAAQPAAAPTSAPQAAAATPTPIDQPSPTAAPTATPAPTAQVIALTQPYDPASMEVLERINDWRVSQGLWPFKVNADLTRLAQAQADFLAGLSVFPDDPHAGPTGEQPKQRAADAGWPFYNTPDQIAVDEVAYTGASPASAVTWWQGSPIHARTLTQTAYREIGVADADKGHGHVYVGDVGSRPNEAPVLLDPASGTWYFSSEQYRWALGDRLQQVTRFAFLTDPSAQVDASAWQVYALKLPAADLGGELAVALNDGQHTVVTPISLPDDIAWLTSDASLASLTITPAPSGAVAVAADATPAPGTPAPGLSAPAQPTAQPTPTESAPAGPALPANANLTLVYGAISMTLWHNPPGGPIDLSGVVLKADDGEQIAAQDFDGPWLGVPLKTFSVGSCLQTWPMSADQGDPGVVTGCYVRASVINLKAKSKFWLKGPFDVLNNGSLLRQCPVGPATCGVVLP